jgi:hypothetical protein
LKQVRDQAQFGNMLPDALGVWASAGILSPVLLPKNINNYLKNSLKRVKKVKQQFILGLCDTVEAFMLLFLKEGRRKVAQYLIKGDNNIP